ncbi:unnamed protein product [Closterium sp. Yama58-4]|nr:unnamed protein product [Closterium sp. Yama58-4]
MFYGAMVWDPWLIVAQIACLQSLFYLSLGVFLWLFVGSHVPRFTLKYFFDYSVISPSSFVGWCCIFAFLANAFVGAFYLVVVVERTKKCLDFAATVHLLHALLCLLYEEQQGRVKSKCSKVLSNLRQQNGSLHLELHTWTFEAPIKKLLPPTGCSGS